MSQQATIIAGFPGIGKSHFTGTHSSNHTFIDLDTSTFSHINGTPNPSFPQNYISHILTLLPTPNLVILVGVHDIVRDQLVANNIDFTLVYPEQGLKEEYVQRWTRRGSGKAFVDKVGGLWDSFTGSCRGQRGCSHVVLGEGMYLSDVMARIL